ncbi:unnamed protein product [Orchesella dallaii]|uniref:G-protein coupled receptors family 1 profile domain-containing protein n=1 Tax=Orchesella dallaii TaxID=48710 RepID=A0ABP1Q1U9_9HEXA
MGRTNLSVFMCTLIDTPESGEECSVLNSSECIRCNLRGGYLSGESIHDYHSIGHVISLSMWLLTIILGIGGLLGNYLIIRIVKKRNSERPFDILLMVLAAFDTFCCIVTGIGTTVTILCFQDWVLKGYIFMYIYYLSFSTVLFGRSASVFTTLLITIQSYLMIAFPVSSIRWFTSRSTKILSICVFIIAICLAVPRFSSMYIGLNPYHDHAVDHEMNKNVEQFRVSGLHRFHYLILPTKMHRFWYHTLNRAHMQIDFWLPLPLLIFFKFLTFSNVRKLNKKRKELNVSQEKQLQAVSMFLPVVILLFICNVAPILFYFLMELKAIVYREMYMLLCLSTALNSSLNFLIYYFRSRNFRIEADAMLSSVSSQFYAPNVYHINQRERNKAGDLEWSTSNNRRHSGSNIWY